MTSFDGSYKGAGLALMIQILAGSLAGSVYAQNDTDCDYGSLLIALDPSKFAGHEFLDEQTEQIITAYKQNSDTELFYPGERSEKKRIAAMESGEIEIDEALFTKLKKYL
ncbi:MAG: Malate/L-lactate dehydrogenase [candidate division WS6 bacterium OLB20]|uniref:Malate/L-lactate dehydrogenase n=1 Tax=candidate division WS6 bacterium OLB20 TaxID=1617426 RepID=A0A136M148_9BACT|nr:MAG: Malate/L-lactate dehydrogenase [candidate division WS6 bacterium OLB20]